jgi:UPF0755 protein
VSFSICFLAKRFVVMLGRLLALCALAVFYLWLYYHAPAGRIGEAQVIDIPLGTSRRQIATRLEQVGVIRHGWMFLLYVTWLRPSPHLQAGEYTLRATMSPVQIVDILRSGKGARHVLTIPEGSTVRDIAALVATKGLGEQQVIVDLVHDKAFIMSLGLTVSSLEGYLFPETYHVPRGISARDLLTLMVRTLQANYTEDIIARGRDLGLTQHEVLTLASLIEKEARHDEERPLIAAVYHNRLQQGMRLQCDPTVIYALGEAFDGNLHKADLSLDSPYNTYRYAGLPPGPIASPGRRAIEAAVAPAPVDYLYFVAMQQEGRHQFSRTLPEHAAAVQKYQLSTHTTP